MTLEDALSQYADRLEQIADDIAAGVLDDVTEQQLRQLIEGTPRQRRRTLVEDYPGLASIESALGLDPTFPPRVTAADLGDAIEIVDEETQTAIDTIESLLEPGPRRGLEWFEALQSALRTGVAQNTPINQSDLDALPDTDRERLADRATEQVNQIRREELELDDFRGIQRVTRRGSGRGVSYFENVIDELRGDAQPNRVPADELEDAPEHVIDEAIERAETAIEELQQTDRDQRQSPVGDRLAGERQPGGQMGFDTGDSETLGTDIVSDEDYMDGTPIARDYNFEERFARLAIRMGDRRRFDFGNADSPADRQNYFALTPEHQREFFDVTPQEYMARLIRGDDVSRGDLLRLGFSEDELPDPDDI